jgi:predicted GNAT family N-acyltransferase
MTFIEIHFGTSAYHTECALRHVVLRAPLGLSLHDEDLSQERDQLHFGLLDGGTLAACVIAVLLSPTEAKIRQMAVRPEHQGKGCGRRMIEELERYLIAKGISHISMHARMSAEGFYEKLGYLRTGDEFTEVGIPHVRMEKRVE